MSLEDRAAAVAPLAAPFPVACDPRAVASVAHVGHPAVRGDIDVVLPMRHAGTRRLRLAWELAGPEGAPVVLVSGGISAGRHLAASASFSERGWAEAIVGGGRALDPSQLRLLAFDHVGADGTLDAVIDTADQADAAAVLIDALGIARLHAFVGYSYGAAVALQFATRHGARLERVVAVSGAHRAHPWAAAWRALQRKAVALGELQCAGDQGLSLARQFAMLGYRSGDGFAERFAAPAEVVNGCVRVAAEDYLDAAGARFVASTPVLAWQRLSESLDLHRVDPAAVRAPATVVAVEGDPLVPLSEAVALVEGLGGPASLRVLRSPHGHDAFLKDDGRVDAILRTALGEEVAA
ncbi:homoserine O-succinyltransferase MetX [Luteimonas terricola]|uniref:Homoserine O-acetyltransferase n=1 Tax=Luteimonas terricola TaxID=645597 RepID=A0ABQ2EH94_9GAMM|nr:homoserine O-succinyltransferase [Luteimonas terricola]GGK12312.1 homoserine O-acetyltransferase [Luteimonas terricola]